MPSPLVQPICAIPPIGRTTASANTIIRAYIPPYTVPGSSPITGSTSGGQTGGRPLAGVPHITTLHYVVGTTAHTLTVLRPLNFTTFSADAAAGQAVVSLTADPGIYSTSYKYPLPPRVTAPRIADNAIANLDVCLYMAADGTWVLDLAGGAYSAGTVTMTTNLPTGGVKKGDLFYFFGVTTDSDPATGNAHLQMDILAAGSATVLQTYTDPSGLWNALHPGDPLVLSSSNGTVAGFFELVTGYYARG